MDTLLDIANIPDYPNALNGLQLENSGDLAKIAASVDFSMASVRRAVEENANLIIVHHGMFWAGLQPLTSVAYSRIRKLIENDIAVYSAHLPLDRHPQFGNNVLLSHELGLTPSGEFASYKGSSIGVRGECNLPTSTLIERAEQFATIHRGRVTVAGLVPHQVTRHWAICTGAGASSDTLNEAATLGIDTLIVGEGPHHTAVEAAEMNITVIYAGHYATETLGVRALAEHVAGQFDLEWTMIDVPTGL